MLLSSRLGVVYCYLLAIRVPALPTAARYHAVVLVQLGESFPECDNFKPNVHVAVALPSTLKYKNSVQT